MVKLTITQKFKKEHKKFIKKSKVKEKSTAACLKIFSKNPNHPSLHLEKLKNSKVWTIRVDRGNRVFFYWTEENSVLLVDIGPHDKYRYY